MAHRLQIFALQQQRAAQVLAQPPRDFQRRLHLAVVHMAALRTACGTGWAEQHPR